MNFLVLSCGCQVIFSKDWRLPGSTEGIPISWFSVHKSEEPSLMENSTVLSGNILDLGKVYMAMDVPWSGPTAPYYWVTVRDSEGNQVSSSQPKTPLENEGTRLNKYKFQVFLFCHKSTSQRIYHCIC